MIERLSVTITERQSEKLRTLAVQENKSVEEYVLALISHALGVAVDKFIDEIDAQRTIEEMAEYGLH